MLSACAHAAPGDTLRIQPRLYLERAPVVFDGSKPARFISGGGRVVIAPDTPPANDEYGGAAVPTGASPIAYGANYSANRNDNDPLPASAQQIPAHFGKSVWWRWLAPAQGLVVATTYGSDFSAVLDVSCATPSGPAHLPMDERVWYRPNEVGFAARAGIEYALLTGGDSGDYGQITLEFSYVEAPVNDLFTNAIAIPQEGAVLSGTSLGATHESAWEPSHAASPATNSVWFRWTAPLSNFIAQAPMRMSTAGSNFDTVLAVYTNDAQGQLFLVASNNNRSVRSLHSRVVFTPAARTTYHIALDGGFASDSPRDRSGNYLLTLDHSFVDLRAVAGEPAINWITDEATFTGHLDVRDHGVVSTAPLRLQVLGRLAADPPGIHRAPVLETNLSSPSAFLLPAGLRPNESASFPFTIVCPGLWVMNGGSNFWGVFVRLDEQVGGDWLPVDIDLIGYGAIPEQDRPILSWGPGRPLPPALASSQLSSIVAVSLEGPPWVMERSTNQFFFLVNLTPSGQKSHTSSKVALRMVTLNHAFRPARIQFVYAVRELRPSRFRRVPTAADAEELKRLHALDPRRQHNVFVTDTPEDEMGRSTFPWDETALTASGTVTSRRRFGANEIVLIHELGHALGLWHTDHAWEQWQRPGSVCPACTETDPDRTGDRCSDTPPTPLQGTPAGACLPVGSGDPCTGRAWPASVAGNYMSRYPFCDARFTPQQAGRMRAWIDWHLAGWLDAVTPLPPEGLCVTLTPFNEVQLVWTDFAENETGFEVERSVGDGPFARLAAPPANAVKFTDASRPANLTCSYRVRAVNGGASSAYSLPADVLTGSPPRILYIDWANPGEADGTQAHPHRTLQAGCDAAAGPTVLRLSAGTYQAGFLLNKVLRLEAVSRSVLIQNP